MTDDELTALEAILKATQKIRDGAATRKAEAERSAALAQKTYDSAVARCADLHQRIGWAKAERVQRCSFEDEMSEKCTEAAAWRIVFPKAGKRVTDLRAYFAGRNTTETRACHDHLYLMTDDYSGNPALVAPIKRG